MAIQARYKNKVQVNMTDEQLKGVKRISDDTGVSNAEVIRQALEIGLPELLSRLTQDA